MNRKIAFLGVVPHAGGTYTVFLNLREGFSALGIELRWVVAGNYYAAKSTSSEEGMEWGEVIASQESNDKAAACLLSRHLLENYDGAIVNVLCDRLCTNTVRYLPDSFARIMLVHNITLGTYIAARSIRDHVHGTVGVSLRIANDLVRKYGFEESRTRFVPNAVPVQRFTVERRPATECLHILVLSRIEHKSKGIFRIPRILDRLHSNGISYECTVAGDGPDLEELKKRCAGMAVKFIGRIDPSAVPTLVAMNDAYLFPSTYEGFGLSLVEAMAGGSVPVSSRLDGVTDQIVEHGISGFLVSSDDIDGYSDALGCLHTDREGLARMGKSARVRVSELFSVESVTERVLEAFDEFVGLKDGKLKTPPSLEQWRYPRGLKTGLRTWLPEPLKNMLRELMEKRVNR